MCSSATIDAANAPVGARRLKQMSFYKGRRPDLFQGQAFVLFSIVQNNKPGLCESPDVTAPEKAGPGAGFPPPWRRKAFRSAFATYARRRKARVCRAFLPYIGDRCAEKHLSAGAFERRGAGKRRACPCGFSALRQKRRRWQANGAKNACPRIQEPVPPHSAAGPVLSERTGRYITSFA